VLRIKFGAGRQFSASKSASSPSAKTLAEILTQLFKEKSSLLKNIKFKK
jgi:hypothetical protein